MFVKNSLCALANTVEKVKKKELVHPKNIYFCDIFGFTIILVVHKKMLNIVCSIDTYDVKVLPCNMVNLCKI